VGSPLINGVFTAKAMLMEKRVVSK
jgi:hypothetical protein